MTRYAEVWRIFSSLKPLWAVAAVFSQLKIASVVPGARIVPTEFSAWALIWIAALLKLVSTTGSYKDTNILGPSLIAVCVIAAFTCERLSPVEYVTPLLAPLVLLMSHMHQLYIRKERLSLQNVYKVVTDLSDMSFIMFSLVTAVALLREVNYKISILAAIVYLAALTLMLDNKAQPTKIEEPEEDLERDPEKVSIDLSSPEPIVDKSRSSTELVAVRAAALLFMSMVVTPQPMPLAPLAFCVIALSRAAFWVAMLDMKLNGLSVNAAALYSFGVLLFQIHLSTVINRGVILCGLSIFLLWHPRSWAGVKAFAGSPKLRYILTALPLLALLSAHYPMSTNHNVLPQAPISSSTGGPAAVQVPVASTTGQQPAISTDKPTPLVIREHPIARLVEEAWPRAAAIEYNQSATVQQAIARYEADFGRAPPPGFKEWFHFAQEHNALVDNYQTLTRSLHKFAVLPPGKLRTYGRAAVEKDPENFAIISIVDGKATVTKRARMDWFLDILVEWLTPLPEFIPDVELYINALEEPRIAVPQGDILLAEKTVVEGDSPISFQDISKTDISKFVRTTCPLPASGATRKPKTRQERLDSFFIANTTAAADVCENPSLMKMHAFYISPERGIFTTQPVPTLSHARAFSFSDPLIPAPYYERWQKFGEYSAEEDWPWDNKLDKVYWAGRTSNGYAIKDNWHKFQRSRLVDLVRNLARPVTLFRFAKGTWRVVNVTLEKTGLAKYFDIKLIGPPVQCDSPACEDMEKHYKMGGMESMHSTGHAKLVFDLDGNIFSGRYYRLLHSRSAVLKQTIFQEWHDDRLVPWVHYIPISLDMHEFPEVVRYLLESEDGKMLARNVAWRSRDWAKRHLRSIDLRIAMLRSVIEYAWLMNDERKVPGDH